MTIYILMHEYSDRSAFHVCGITQDNRTATAWYMASDEANVYSCQDTDSIKSYMEGVEGWRQTNARYSK